MEECRKERTKEKIMIKWMRSPEWDLNPRLILTGYPFYLLNYRGFTHSFTNSLAYSNTTVGHSLNQVLVPSIV